MPASDHIELFLRAGVGAYILTYDSYAVDTGTGTSLGTVAYTGNGYGFGVGAEMMFDKLGVGVGYTMHSASFNQATGGGISGELPSETHADISSLDVLVTYHFP